MPAPTQRCPDCRGEIGVRYAPAGNGFACSGCDREFTAEELLKLTDTDTTRRSDRDDS